MRWPIQLTELRALCVAAVLAPLLGGCEQLAHTRSDEGQGATTGVGTSGHAGSSSTGSTSRGSVSSSAASSGSSGSTRGSSTGSSAASAGSTGSTTSSTTATSGTGSTTGSTTATSGTGSTTGTTTSGTTSTGTTGQAPGAPTGVAVSIDGQPSSTQWTASVTWQAPPSSGSSPILSYTLTATAPANPGGTAPPPVTAQLPAGFTSAAGFGPLVVDAHYSFTVTATNGQLTGPPSTPVAFDACPSLTPPSFAPAASPQPFLGGATSRVLLRDLNGDGQADLVAAVGQNIVWALAAADGGIGQLHTEQARSSNPIADFAVGDINGNAVPDVVVLYKNDPRLYTLLGSASGGFGSGPSVDLLSLAGTPFSPAYNDVAIRPRANGALPAIEVADTGNNQVLDVENLFPGPARGTANPINQASGGLLTGLLCAPLSVGASDAVIAVDDAANIDYWLARSGGLSPAFSVIGPGVAQGVAAADLDGDGLTDLVIGANAVSQTLSVVLGAPGGFSSTWRTYPLPGASDANATLAIADVNADGIPDIINADTGAGSVSVLLGVGDGGFAPDQAVLSNLSGPASLAAGDFNGDGRPDLAIAFQGTPVIQLYANTLACH